MWNKYAEELNGNTINWYKMFLLQDSNYSENSYYQNPYIKTSMAWGSQWDQMVNFILKGSDREKSNIITGNHIGSVAKTGDFGSDIANNIFDLGSNIYDSTQEAYSTTYREGRGGYYATTSNYSILSRASNSATSTSASIGTRMSMYIKINE